MAEKAVPISTVAVSVPGLGIRFNDMTLRLTDGTLVRQLPARSKGGEIPSLGSGTKSPAAVSFNLALASTIGNTNEALKEFDEALRIDGNSAEAHFTVGSLLRQMGRRDEAIAHLAEALRLKPDYEYAKQQLRELGMRYRNNRSPEPNMPLHTIPDSLPALSFV
jgi:tetratricopeptide (TPR) repeat protein